ncbi:MAG: transketolase [Candidatus Diapherotrites archaeon]|nr:transketolase [Candidatus Diapherotrites archaeon]
MNPFNFQDTVQLQLLANDLRQEVIRILCESKSGHSAGSLGMADVFAVLYFNVLSYNPKDPAWKDRDRLILSNGHICPIQYASMAYAGFFPKTELFTLRKLGSRLQGHPHTGSLPGIENNGGPLGQGLSQAVGISLVCKLENKSFRVYCITGDGEHNEGQIWEAIETAAKYKLHNLIVIVDRNRIQMDGPTEVVMPLDSLAEKYAAFGWNVLELDGHNIPGLLQGFEKAKLNKSAPLVIIANTIPGKDVAFMENSYDWHGKVPTVEQAQQALLLLENIHKKIADVKN